MKGFQHTFEPILQFHFWLSFCHSGIWSFFDRLMLTDSVKLARMPHNFFIVWSLKVFTTCLHTVFCWIVALKYSLTRFINAGWRHCVKFVMFTFLAGPLYESALNCFPSIFISSFDCRWSRRPLWFFPKHFSLPQNSGFIGSLRIYEIFDCLFLSVNPFSTGFFQFSIVFWL